MVWRPAPAELDLAQHPECDIVVCVQRPAPGRRCRRHRHGPPRRTARRPIMPIVPLPYVPTSSLSPQTPVAKKSGLRLRRRPAVDACICADIVVASGLVAGRADQASPIGVGGARLEGDGARSRLGERRFSARRVRRLGATSSVGAAAAVSGIAADAATAAAPPAAAARSARRERGALGSDAIRVPPARWRRFTPRLTA